MNKLHKMRKVNQLIAVLTLFCGIVGWGIGGVVYAADNQVVGQNKNETITQNVITNIANPLQNTVNGGSKAGRANPDNTSPVVVTTDDTQNFFTAVGTANVQANADGTWSNIQLTSQTKNQVGAVSLNTRINMSMGFNFNWQIKIKGSSPADGIGFALHPTYSTKTDTSITDSQSGVPVPLPTTYGRSNTGVPDGSGQGLHSLGLKGGNLGISDLMNVIGFKIDPYQNTSIPGSPNAGTFYGDTSHGDGTSGQVYSQSDPSLDQTSGWFPTASFSPFATFVNTDYTGYAYYPTNDSNGGNATQPQLIGGPNATLNVFDNTDKWYNMSMNYDAGQNVLTVSLANTDNSNAVTWTRNLTANELLNVQQKPYWAFTILASTGQLYEQNNIRNITGRFYPERAVITRYVDENGSDLMPSSTVDYTDWAADHNTNPNTYTQTNNTPTITKNGGTYTRSQLNRMIYDINGYRSTVRLTTTNQNGENDILDNSNGTSSTWNVSYPFNNSSSITYLTYVYRKNLTNSEPGIAVTAKNVTSGTTGNTLTVKTGDTVQLTYNVTNPSTGPSTWIGVYGVQNVPNSLSYVSGTGVTKPITTKPNTYFIPMNNKDGNNNLMQGTSGTNTVSFTYKGATSATLNADGTGISINNGIVTTKTALYLYDHSPQIIGTDGANTNSENEATADPNDKTAAPSYGSYYLNTTNKNSPLAASPTAAFNVNLFNNDTANFEPMSSLIALNETNSPIKMSVVAPNWIDFGKRLMPKATSDTLTYLPVGYYTGSDEKTKQDLMVNETTNTYQVPWTLSATANTSMTNGTNNIANSPLTYWKNGVKKTLNATPVQIDSGSGTKNVSQNWLRTSQTQTGSKPLNPDGTSAIGAATGNGLAVQFVNNGTSLTPKTPYNGTITWTLTYGPI